MSKEDAKQKIVELVAIYNKLTPKEIKSYTEADTRRTFILPLFGALAGMCQVEKTLPKKKKSLENEWIMLFVYEVSLNIF